jgi:hypothetical protein
MPEMTRGPAIAFANQLRSARLAALGDAEAFDGIIHALERIGSYLSEERLGDQGKPGNLGQYSDLKQLASSSAIATETPNQFRNILTPFAELYDLVSVARNDALHQGAFARHLTKHAIELAIILEDALGGYMDLLVMGFMVRNPVCAEFWQPLGFIRQQMLANSYSYLPALGEDGSWRIVSDAAVATFLGPERKGPTRAKRLASQLKEMWSDLPAAAFIDEKAGLSEALNRFQSTRDPVLLILSPGRKDLVGILTAFDLP